MEKKGRMSDAERLELATKLDRELDDFINGLEKKPYSDGWPEDKWQEEIEKHPFFMKTLPKEGDELHPLFEGLQQLKYDPDENTPEELALSYKEDGNFNYKHKNYRLAILAYTEGIKIKCGNIDIEAALLNNRSAANYFLKNYRSSLRDCELALKLKSDYQKVIFRAAQCCYELKKFDKALEYCQKILNKEKNEEILELIKKCNKESKIKIRDMRKKDLDLKKKHAMEKQLLEGISNRNVNCHLFDLEPKLPQLVNHSVHFNETNELVWPVVFLYPEYEIMDFIQEFPENTSFAEQLNQMFDSSPEWDIEKKYICNDLRMYFESFGGEIVTVEIMKSLGEILCLKQYTVKNGTPSFFVFVKNSEAEKNFLSKYNK